MSQITVLIPEVMPLQEPLLSSGLDTLVVAGPFILFLGFGLFRLDALVAAPQRPLAPARSFCELDDRGELQILDPDGRRAQE